MPGEIGIWVFIFGDLAIFSLFFGVFVYERGQHPELFEAGRKALGLTAGAINTLLLLSGSLFVVLALHALRAAAGLRGRVLLGLALLCGTGFVANKAVEYTHLAEAGQTPAASDFFMYFFVFTGIHLLHLLLGLIALAIIWRIARKPVLAGPDLRNLEAGASYWHLVDLLWIVLFALLYLVR